MMTDPYPKLIVFDLDFTLWNCGGSWIDATIWPFENLNGRVYDAEGREFELYPDVDSIISNLESQDLQLALASRTMEPEWANWLLDAWKMTDRFHHREIYPGSKLQHFGTLKKRTKFAYKDMLFFDDEERNIREVGELGVTAVHVLDGLGKDVFEDGLARWRASQD